jgi:transposase
MSRRDRRKFTATFKTEVVLEALKERKTMSELAQQFDLHPNQIATWKREFLQGAVSVFESAVDAEREALKQKQDELFQQIGKLQVENDFLKKECCDEPFGATPVDRPGAPGAHDRRAVRGAWPLAQHAVLQAQARQRSGPADHAAHGRTAPGGPHARAAPDAAGTHRAGLQGGSRPSAQSDAAHAPVLCVPAGSGPRWSTRRATSIPTCCAA